MPVLSSDVEARILGVLQEFATSGQPVKARTIARILGIEKRQVNSFLYRARAFGKVERDDYFRWFVKEGSAPAPLPKLEEILLEDEALESELETPSSTTTIEEYAAPGTASELPTEPTAVPVAGTCGPFTLSEEARSYDRYCSWCSDKIAARQPSLVVRIAGKHKAKFCREECWQNWESIYWQRVALKRLNLKKDDFIREQRTITRQKRFLGYGWRS